MPDNLPVLYDREFAFWQHCAQWAPGTWVAAHVIEAQIVDEWNRAMAPLYVDRSMFYDRTGQPINVEQWGQLRELGVDPDGRYGKNAYVRVGQDVIGEVEVSTVWLGMDHGFGFGRDADEYKPVIFETMIFGGKYSDWQRRYCTEWEAIKGHAEAVVDVRAGMEPWWSYGGQEDDEWHMEGR